MYSFSRQFILSITDLSMRNIQLLKRYKYLRVLRKLLIRNIDKEAMLCKLRNLFKEKPLYRFKQQIIVFLVIIMKKIRKKTATACKCGASC